MSLHGVKTILAITGGIAAFKALAVLRLLKHHGADVYVVMTEHATHFLTPASWRWSPAILSRLTCLHP